MRATRALRGPSAARLALVALGLAGIGVPLAPAPVEARQATAAPSGVSRVLADLERRLEADVTADSIGGIVAGVAVGGDLIWARGFGLADRDGGEPMHNASISRTGSISKSVTALLLMVLVDRGVVALDDPVTDHLPEAAGFADPRPGSAPVTLRHLASHTAGLVREPDLADAAAGPIAGWEEKVLASIPATAFDSVPGARYQYSNIGFGVLGLALSRAAGRPFMALVEEGIFAPLGMTGSTFVVGDELEPRLARGYANRRDGTVDAEAPAREHAGRGYKVPNGGVYSTVADLARFAGAISGVPGLRILTEASRREMLTVQTPENPRDGYGLGLSLEIDDEGRVMAGHGGSVAGYTAALAFDPDARIAVVLLRNYSQGRTNLGGVAEETVRAMRGVVVPPYPSP